jgi:hypothetical protein
MEFILYSIDCGTLSPSTDLHHPGALKEKGQLPFQIAALIILCDNIYFCTVTVTDDASLPPYER